MKMSYKTVQYTALGYNYVSIKLSRVKRFTTYTSSNTKSYDLYYIEKGCIAKEAW